MQDECSAANQRDVMAKDYSPSFMGGRCAITAPWRFVAGKQRELFGLLEKCVFCFRAYMYICIYGICGARGGRYSGPAVESLRQPRRRVGRL